MSVFDGLMPYVEHRRRSRRIGGLHYTTCVAALRRNMEQLLTMRRQYCSDYDLSWHMAWSGHASLHGALRVKVRHNDEEGGIPQLAAITFSRETLKHPYDEDRF